MTSRRSVLSFAASALASPWLAAAHAKTEGAASWKPASKVEFIVPSGAGAALDGAARKLTGLLAEHGAAPQFVVQNRSSAHALHALQVLQQNEGNPHYLMSLSSSLVYSDAQHALPVPYTNFTPLALLFTECTVVAVRADSPLKTGLDLVARLRADPGALSIGVATTVGNHIHLGIAKPLKAGGVDIVNLRVVPYRSSAESTAAVLGGHLDVVSATTPNLLPHLASGRVRVLAVAAPQRLGGAFQGVPTWREQGIDAIGQSVQGVMAPKGITAPQRDYWTDALREVARSGEWREYLELNQWTPNFLDGPQAAAHLARERDEVRGLLGELNLLSS